MRHDGDCDKYLKRYFGIRKYKHGDFSPSGLQQPVGASWRSVSMIRPGPRKPMTSGEARSMASKSPMFRVLAITAMFGVVSPFVWADQAKEANSCSG